MYQSKEDNKNESRASSKWVCPNDRILTLRAKLDTGWSVRSNLMNQQINCQSASSTGFINSASGRHKSVNKFNNCDDTSNVVVDDNLINGPIDMDTLDQPRPSAALLMSSSPTINSIESMSSFSNHNLTTSTTTDFKSSSGRQMNYSNSGHRSGTSGQRSFESSTSSIISEEEQMMIINVIKKSQQLEQLEKDRVEKLIDRLNNLKRNSKCGDGKNCCSLCSDSFGRIFGSRMHICKDCSKAICTKCGLDTVTSTGDTIWFCKICSETREMWKKSGAWFFKSIPYYYSNYCHDYDNCHRKSTASDDSNSTIQNEVSKSGSSNTRKFFSCKESSTYQMYQSKDDVKSVASNVVEHFNDDQESKSLTTIKSSVSNASNVNHVIHNANHHNYGHGHQLHGHEHPSPSPSMVSLDSIATINSTASTINSIGTFGTNNSLIQTPTQSINFHVQTPTSMIQTVITSPTADQSSAVDQSSADGRDLAPSPGFTRNKYNANSIRILSSRSPIRRKGSSRRHKNNQDHDKDNESVSSFQTMASVNNLESARCSEGEDQSEDAFECAMKGNANKRFGLQSKTSEFAASLRVKDGKKVASTELWELHSDSSDTNTCKE